MTGDLRINKPSLPIVTVCFVIPSLNSKCAFVLYDRFSVDEFVDVPILSGLDLATETTRRWNAWRHGYVLK